MLLKINLERHGIGGRGLCAGTNCALSGDQGAKPEPWPVQWEQLD